MSYNDQEIRDILVAYSKRGRKQQSWGVIDPYRWDPLQAGSTNGSSGVSYYYMECAEKLKTENWPVANRSGNWQRIGTEPVDGYGRYPVMYKEKRKFIPRGRNGPKNWVMTVYTLDRIESGKIEKAICAIQEEGSSRQ